VSTAFKFTESGSSPPAIKPTPRTEWIGMPEFMAEDLKAFHKIKVWLTTQKPSARRRLGYRPSVMILFRKKGLAKNLSEVSERLNAYIDSDTRATTLHTDEQGLAKLLYNGAHKIARHSTWFPWRPNDCHCAYAYRQEVGKAVNPEYPIYIISKGRWDFLLTARALERMGVRYTIVVEPKEYANYETAFAGTYDDDYGGRKPFTLGVLHKAPENFSERGCGSIPVRNYVWDLALKTGKARHWLMDDSIPSFIRLNHNLHIRLETGAALRAMEIFCDRYENCVIAGCQNNQFAEAKAAWPPFELNTKIFSCTLIQNDLRLMDGLSKTEINETQGRWRGRYNEDVDLLLRTLKAGLCTVCFITFNSEKIGHDVKMSGGNTDTIYAVKDYDLLKSESLVVHHPDVTRLTHRFSRWHHNANYKKAARIGGNPVLKLREGVVIPEGVNNYGMVLCERATGKKVTWEDVSR
jgi:hypothetical protein